MKRPVALLLAAVTLFATACGEDEPAAGPSAASDAPAGAFPVTLDHRYGSTTLEAAPERIVVAGLREQDALLALGAVPVGVTEWIPTADEGIHPWAKAALGDADPPELLKDTDGIQIERIAALRPDVIVAVYSGMSKKDYETLSKIAPVVAMPKGKPDFGSTWQEETLTAGRIVGKEAEAEGLVADRERLLARTAKEHPEFQGASAAMAMDYQGAFVYGPDDMRTQTLEALGFEYPDSLRDAFPGEFGGQLADERIDELDLDAMVWIAEPQGAAKLKRGPVYSKLDVRKEGRDVFLAAADPGYAAVPFVTVLSLPTLVDTLVPRLAAAVDGDPSTPTGA